MCSTMHRVCTLHIVIATYTSSSMNAAPELCLGCDDRGFVAVLGQTQPHEQRISACYTVLERMITFEVQKRNQTINLDSVISGSSEPRKLKQVCMKCFYGNAIGKNRKFSRKQWARLEAHHVHVLHSSQSVAALILESLRLPVFCNGTTRPTARGHVTSPCHHVHVKTFRLDG